VDSLASTDKVAAAMVASRLPGTEGKERLRGFLRDSSPEVAQAAAVSAARAGQLELVFPIIDMLAAHKLRTGARQALLLYGETILGTLGDVLRDPRRDPVVRREIASVRARIPVKRSAELLIDNLNADDPLFQYRIVKALDRLHEAKPDLLKARTVVADKVYAQSRSYYERLAFCHAIETEGAGKRLLLRALRERMKEDLEILFRLLALDYPRKEMYFAFTALQGGRAELRTSAIEFLDNVLSQRMKLVLLPLLEESSSADLMARGEQLFGIKPLKRDEALRVIASRPDPWLKACAEYEMAAG
jgi:AAA family ATP:ADP antiporter